MAEFSFRVRDRKERFTRGLAASARSLYESLQHFNGYRPDARTKTEFIYRDDAGV